VLQLPEVKLELAHGTKRGSSHSLEASLTAEGARVFKVDGRLKSGTQVKVSSVQRPAVVNGHEITSAPGNPCHSSAFSSMSVAAMVYASACNGLAQVRACTMQQTRPPVTHQLAVMHARNQLSCLCGCSRLVLLLNHPQAPLSLGASCPAGVPARARNCG
jgi:hypothetical protein